MSPKNPRWEDRDWLVLSKGHAGPVAYATFGLVGFYPMEEAYTLNQPHTKFPSHTDLEADARRGSRPPAPSDRVPPLPPAPPSATKLMAVPIMFSAL